MRFWGLFAGVWVLAGCSAGSDTVATTHDACAPLALVASSPTTAQQDALDAAQTLWRDHGAPVLGSGEPLEVRFEPAADAFHGLYDRGIIYINDSLSTEPMLSIVIAHELGHAFGLQHVANRPSVMNAGNLDLAPNDDDRAALAALWGACN